MARHIGSEALESVFGYNEDPNYDVVAKNLTAHWMVGDLIMYQRLPQ